MKEIKLTFPGGKTLAFPYGIRADALLEHMGIEPEKIAAVKMNKQVLPLSTRIEINASLEPVPLDGHDGVMIYRRSLAFLLAMAAREIFPRLNLQVGHSLGNSYYYTFVNTKKLSPDEIAALQQRMRELVASDLPIDYHYMAYGEALALFKKKRQYDTAGLLELRNDAKIRVNACKDFADLYIEPLVSRTGLLVAFELQEYEDGFLLRFPGMGQGSVIGPQENNGTIFSVYREYKKWGKIIGVRGVGQLNDLISQGKIQDYIRIAEAFQARKMGEIAAQIYKKRDSLRVVLIAGPSSSGKTTSAKLLAVSLQVLGLKPVQVSLDDFYRGTEFAPIDENGQRDFECLEALDVPYLNQQLLALFRGEEAEIPAFDFKSGRRKEGGGRMLRLDRRSILILEGIHGLNDALTPDIPRRLKFKLYVSALTQLNLDDHNRIPTSDNRLLRRMVRDHRFRGSSAAGTIAMWPSVQRGERRHIFPFQNSADAAFNSALDYELAVLKYYADPLLRSVKPGQEEYSEAKRLISFLKNFVPIPPQFVPGASILREFIGDSEFKY